MYTHVFPNHYAFLTSNYRDWHSTVKHQGSGAQQQEFLVQGYIGYAGNHVVLTHLCQLNVTPAGRTYGAATVVFMHLR